MTSTRWLLNGSPDAVGNPLWHSILTVDGNKQLLFLKRILFLHARASKRGGKAAACRLSLGDWNAEVERMCLAIYIMDQMLTATSHDGKNLFDEATLDKVSKRTIHGFLDDLVLDLCRDMFGHGVDVLQCDWM